MTERKIRTERKTNDYGGLTAIGHVYKRLDMYAGSSNKKKHTNLIYDNEKLVNKEIRLPEAVQRVFLEIISNAGDNADASRRAGINPGKIEISVNSNTVRIKNAGLAIPVEKIVLEENGSSVNVRKYKKDDKDFTWLPAYIFGYLRSSNNYDDENVIRTGAGRNGIGAKLTNILSKRFLVEIEDPDTKLKFSGLWKDNMFMNDETIKPEVNVVKDETIKTGSVAIEWDLDFERFKMKKYDIEDLALFCRFAVDYSFACKVITTFNGVEFDYRDINKYASLFFPEEIIETSIIKYSWKNKPKDLEKCSDVILTKKIVEAKKPEYIPELEVLILDTPDDGKIISYVNGLITIEGGVHVDCVQDPVNRYVCSLINGDKKKDKDKSNASSGIITARNVKPHISFIINARLMDTEYNSQSKTKLTSPEPVLVLEEKKLKQISNWNLIQRLHSEIDAMALRTATKSDGKKAKHVNIKGSDANRAGTKESLKCALYIVEGKSAAGYPRGRINHLKGGKDYNGLAILKGKLMNITNANPVQYANNQVFGYIKKMIGLREGLDYNAKVNIQTLRYGFLIVNVDADDDGMHILSHFLNFLREKFPGILKQNMVGYLRTPVIKLLKGGKIAHRFFTVVDFNKWKEENSIKGFEIRYYKGLGTSEPIDIEDDLDNAPTVFCIYDEKSNAGFDLAFHKSNADRRKEWIAKWRDVTQSEDVVSIDMKDIMIGKNKLEVAQDISQLLNRELINYSVTSLFRAIPSEYDHLKVSQRKALYAALVYFGYNPQAKGKRIKVGRLVYKAADMVQYHHGEKSLIDTFIKMAQDFTGTNNMGYFYKGGSFGTREDGGDEAADARYSETHLAWWIPFVYYKESIDIIERNIVEGDECEPKWLPGVIPMGIVNGTNGIATGFSTSSPSHNPVDVIDYYLQKCEGKEPDPIMPWFNKFTGRREIKDRDNIIDVEEEILPRHGPMEALEKTNEDMEEEEKDRDESDNMALLKHAESAKLSLKTYGKFSIEQARNDDIIIIKVTELPIRAWFEHYKNWLQTMMDSKIKEKAIIDFDNNSTSEQANFVIKWNKNYHKTPDIKSLRLVRSFGLSNITLINHRGFPTQFEKVQDVMERYYDHMIEHYKTLRKFRISNEENRMRDISYKMKFIVLVRKGDIKIVKISEDIIKEKMKEFEIPYSYYEESKGRDFSEEALEKHKKNLEEAKAKLKLAEETTATKIWVGKLNILRKEILKRQVGKFFNFSK